MNKKTIFLTVSAVILFSFLAIPVSAQIRVLPGVEVGDPAEDVYLKQKLKSIRGMANRGDFDQALAAVESLERTYGRKPEIAGELKYIYRVQKNYPMLKAIVLEEYLANPNDFQTLCELGEAYFFSDSLNLAVSTWEKAFAVAGSSDYNYAKLAMYYRGFGFYDEAVSVLKRARVVLNEPTLFADELSDIFISQRNYPRAASEYLNLMKNEYKSEKAEGLSQQIISIYMESDKPELIVDVIDQAILDDPGNPNLYTILGDIKVTTAKPIEAFDYYKTADSLSNSRGLFLENFVFLCYNNAEYAMAIEAANYFFSKNPNRQSSKVGIIKAGSLAEIGQYNPALELLNTIDEDARDNSIREEAIYLAGEIYADKLADYDSASMMFTRLIEGGYSSSYNSKAAMKLAEIDVIKGDFSQALGHLNEILRSRRDKEVSRQVEFLKAEIAFLTYDFKQASEEYSRLAAEDPRGFYVNDCLDRLAFLTDAGDDTAAYFVADAVQHAYAGRFDNAIEAMKIASQFSDSKAHQYVLYYLAGYYAGAGIWQKSADAYEHYITAYPEGLYIDRALFNLAEIYYKKISRPDKADSLLNQLVTDHPASPLIEKARAYLNIIKSS